MRQEVEAFWSGETPQGHGRWWSRAFELGAEVLQADRAELRSAGLLLRAMLRDAPDETAKEFATELLGEVMLVVDPETLAGRAHPAQHALASGRFPPPEVPKTRLRELRWVAAQVAAGASLAELSRMFEIVEELPARFRALGERYTRLVAARRDWKMGGLAGPPLLLNEGDGTLSWASGKADLARSPRRLALVRAITGKPGISRAALIEEVWQVEPDESSRNALHANISRLRAMVQPAWEIDGSDHAYAWRPQPTLLVASAAQSVAPVQDTPGDLGPFVGRAGLLEQLETRTPLLTVVGPPGVGKTRLAWELGRRWRGAFLFVDLRECQSADDVVMAVAERMGVEGRSVRSRVGKRLQATPGMLLVLDNAEQVQALAALVEEWAGGLHRIVITSRSAVAGVTVEVPVLEEADSHALLELLCEGELDRAETKGLLDMVAGLPLGLHLASRRLALLGPGELAAALGRRLDVVRDRMAEGPHRSLVTLLEHATSDLDDASRDLLGMASLFPGAFSSAEMAASLQRSEPVVHTVLTELLAKSLLQPDEQGFNLLVPLRVFCGRFVTNAQREAFVAWAGTCPRASLRRLETAYRLAVQLESAEATPLGLRVEALMGATSTPAARLAVLGELQGEGTLQHVVWARMAHAEHDARNLPACESWVSRVDEARLPRKERAQFVRLRVRLDFALRAGHWEQIALDGIASFDDDHSKAVVMATLGAGYGMTHRFAEGVELGRRVLELARAAGDEVLVLRGLTTVASNALACGRLAEGMEAARLGESLATAPREKRHFASILGNLLLFTGSADEAIARYWVAHAGSIQVGEEGKASSQLGNVAHAYLHLGELEKSERLVLDALSDPTLASRPRVQWVLAASLLAQGRLPAAARYIEQCLHPNVPEALMLRGLILRAASGPGAAEAQLQASSELLGRVNYVYFHSLALALESLNLAELGNPQWRERLAAAREVRVSGDVHGLLVIELVEVLGAELASGATGYARKAAEVGARSFPNPWVRWVHWVAVQHDLATSW